VSSRAFKEFVEEFCGGDSRNIEARHIVQCAMAVKDAIDPEVKNYLRVLEAEVIESWKGKNKEVCPYCGLGI